MEPVGRCPRTQWWWLEQERRQARTKRNAGEDCRRGSERMRYEKREEEKDNERTSAAGKVRWEMVEGWDQGNIKEVF